LQRNNPAIENSNRYPMTIGPYDWIGWIATALVAISYFCENARRLRLVQAGSAMLWLIYGFLIEAPPVIAANVVVMVLAVYSNYWVARRRATAQPKSGID
jgi:hypothetical protein